MKRPWPPWTVRKIRDWVDVWLDGLVMGGFFFRWMGDYMEGDCVLYVTGCMGDCVDG